MPCFVHYSIFTFYAIVYVNVMYININRFHLHLKHAFHFHPVAVAELVFSLFYAFDCCCNCERLYLFSRRDWMASTSYHARSSSSAIQKYGLLYVQFPKWKPCTTDVTNANELPWVRCRSIMPFVSDNERTRCRRNGIFCSPFSAYARAAVDVAPKERLQKCLKCAVAPNNTICDTQSTSTSEREAAHM